MKKLSHIYDLSSMAVNVMLKERYGDRNVEVIAKKTAMVCCQIMGRKYGSDRGTAEEY
ncbi:MAG: hypothetical protein ACLVBP_02630 [Ruminococcus sp.]